MSTKECLDLYLIYDKIALKVYKRIFHPRCIKIENIVKIEGGIFGNKVIF